MTTRPTAARSTGNVAARGAGVLLLVLGAALSLIALTAAAVAVPAFIILGPWALVAIVVALNLLLGSRSLRVLRLAIATGLASTVLGLLSVVGSTPDFLPVNATFIILSLSAAAYAYIALRAATSKSLYKNVAACDE